VKALGCRGKSVRRVGVDKSRKSGVSNDAGVFDLGWTRVSRAVHLLRVEGEVKVGRPIPILGNDTRPINTRGL
jgi:hypothetical protein